MGRVGLCPTGCPVDTVSGMDPGSRGKGSKASLLPAAVSGEVLSTECACLGQHGPASPAPQQRLQEACRPARAQRVGCVRARCPRLVPSGLCWRPLWPAALLQGMLSRQAAAMAMCPTPSLLPTLPGSRSSMIHGSREQGVLESPHPGPDVLCARPLATCRSPPGHWVWRAGRGHAGAGALPGGREQSPPGRGS